MKLCYADESGTQSRALVMVGIVADAHRLNKSSLEFRDIYREISEISADALRELKSTKIFYGKDEWYGIDPDFRKMIFESFCDWINDRKHGLALAAIDTEKHKTAVTGEIPPVLSNVWLAGALHIALQTQKAHQGLRKNKGHTFLIFDEGKRQDQLAELLYAPPDWTDSYYARNQKSPPLDQIVDSSYFVKSHHAGLVQVADLFAFVFRRLAEIADFGYPQLFEKEGDVIARYARKLAPRLLPKSARWPKTTKSEASHWFTALAPASLLAL